MKETKSLERKPAPAFTLPDADGVMTGIADFAGKWIVLYFYPKDNTSGCTKEALGFTELKDRFAALNAEIIGVSPDSPASHQRFIAKHALGIRLLSDTEKTVMKAYSAWGLKKNYGREYEGVIRTTVLIDPGGGIAREWKKVRVKGHVEKVLETLESLAGELE